MLVRSQLTLLIEKRESDKEAVRIALLFIYHCFRIQSDYLIFYRNSESTIDNDYIHVTSDDFVTLNKLTDFPVETIEDAT